MPETPHTPTHLYIHIPFCTGKCTYCGFYSERFDAERADRFLLALEREMQAVNPSGPRAKLSTLYIGGGTPSLLSSAQWRQLCQMLHHSFDLTRLQEWTLEANPGTFSDEVLDAWRTNGITRVSLGAQSMCDRTLTRIRRRHRAAETVDSITRLQRAGIVQTGIDLIANLPGVSPPEWYDTLQTVIALAPAHVSVYDCSIEPGTPLEAQYRRGQFAPVGTTASLNALDTAVSLLGTAGFEHYEISNFARPGSHCRYNVAVWKGADYLGLGPAAASRIGYSRRTNHADLNAYFAAMWPDGRPPCEYEEVSPETDAIERLLFNFRLSDPFALDAFANRYGVPARRQLPYWEKQLAALAADGLIVMTEGCWHRTAKGIRLADVIAETLLP